MSAAERTKDRSNLLQHWEGRVLGLSSATSRKVLSDRPALKPDWGKPTVRNFREEDGNGSSLAILLPERQSSTLPTWRGLETWNGRDAVTLANERARQRGTQTST